MSWLSRLAAKAEDTFTPVNAGAESARLPLSRFDYRAAVRGGLDSNVVMAPIQWIMRTFPEAEPVVERKLGRKPWARVEEHELEERLRNPNEGYDGACLFQASLISYLLDGNAYWLKSRNVFGGVREYWYLPHWLIEPKWPEDGSRFISHYEYRPDGGAKEDLPPSEIVHLRFGLDPRNTRKGLSQLKALMREVYTDEEAAHFSATILRNMGVPGMIVAPKDVTALPTPADVEELKRYLKTSHTADRRGEPLVMSGPTEVHQFGFDPNRLMLGNLRDIAEERVCAALGIPAAVVGFGAGLQSTKVGATMREMRRLAWVQCIIPLQLSIGRQLTKQLVPDYEGKAWRWRVRFDASSVSAFQEEETEKARRLALMVGAGILRVDHAQEQAGVEVDTSQAVYLRPSGAVVVEEGDPGLESATPAGAQPGEGEDDEEESAREPELRSLMDEAARAIAGRRGAVSGNGGRNGAGS